MYSGDLYAYSVGAGGNYAEDTDCEGTDNMCFLKTSRNCSSEVSFTVTETALESIEGFEYYQAPSGVSNYDYDYDTGWW